jgi:hypothetical protein
MAAKTKASVQDNPATRTVTATSPLITKTAPNYPKINKRKIDTKPMIHVSEGPILVLDIRGSSCFEGAEVYSKEG